MRTKHSLAAAMRPPRGGHGGPRTQRGSVISGEEKQVGMAVAARMILTIMMTRVEGKVAHVGIRVAPTGLPPFWEPPIGKKTTNPSTSSPATRNPPAPSSPTTVYCSTAMLYSCFFLPR